MDDHNLPYFNGYSMSGYQWSPMLKHTRMAWRHETNKIGWCSRSTIHEWIDWQSNGIFNMLLPTATVLWRFSQPVLGSQRGAGTHSHHGWAWWLKVGLKLNQLQSFDQKTMLSSCMETHQQNPQACSGDNQEPRAAGSPHPIFTSLSLWLWSVFVPQAGPTLSATNRASAMDESKVGHQGRQKLCSHGSFSRWCFSNIHSQPRGTSQVLLQLFGAA